MPFVAQLPRLSIEQHEHLRQSLDALNTSLSSRRDGSIAVVTLKAVGEALVTTKLSDVVLASDSWKVDRCPVNHAEAAATLQAEAEGQAKVVADILKDADPELHKRLRHKNNLSTPPAPTEAELAEAAARADAAQMHTDCGVKALLQLSVMPAVTADGWLAWRQQHALGQGQYAAVAAAFNVFALSTINATRPLEADRLTQVIAVLERLCNTADAALDAAEPSRANIGKALDPLADAVDRASDLLQRVPPMTGDVSGDCESARRLIASVRDWCGHLRNCPKDDVDTMSWHIHRERGALEIVARHDKPKRVNWQKGITELWRRWRKLFPTILPPEPLPLCNDYLTASNAAESLLKALEEVKCTKSKQSTEGRETREQATPSPSLETNNDRVTVAHLAPSQAREPGAAGAPAASSPPNAQANVLHLNAEIWHINYHDGGEIGDFPDRVDSIFRHVTRLLAQPTQRWGSSAFYPPPPGAVPIPHMGRDANIGDEGLQDIEARMVQIAKEIKEAEKVNNAETAATLRIEFNALAETAAKEKKAQKRGHKNLCGTLPPIGKANQALLMGLRRLGERLRKGGMPKLAEHLAKYIDNRGGEWVYAPPPGTSPWIVTLPEHKSEK